MNKPTLPQNIILLAQLRENEKDLPIFQKMIYNDLDFKSSIVHNFSILILSDVRLKCGYDRRKGKPRTFHGVEK